MVEIDLKLNEINVVRVAAWAKYGWLQHGFSSRAGGGSLAYSGNETRELNLGFTQEDSPLTVSSNREAFLRAVAGKDAGEMATVRQVHGTIVKLVSFGERGLRTEDGRGIVEADGLMTADTGVMLAIQVADCVPVLVADVKQRVVAAFHAGWRGTSAGIVEQGITRMVTELGCDPEDMVAAVGPSIRVCCYTVGDEVRSTFGGRFGYAEDLFSDREDGMHVDLAEANRRQLLGAGLQADAVTVLTECTACTRVNGRRKYFSHRAERGFTGRSMGLIGIVGE